MSNVLHVLPALFFLISLLPQGVPRGFQRWFTPSLNYFTRHLPWRSL